VPDEEIYYLLMSGRKKSFIKWNFFALLSRNLVGRTKMSKKKSMEKTNSEKNKQDSFVIADSPTTSFYLKKK